MWPTSYQYISYKSHICSSSVIGQVMLSGGLNEVIFLKSTWSEANSFNFDGFSNSSTWPIIKSYTVEAFWKPSLVWKLCVMIPFEAIISSTVSTISIHSFIHFPMLLAYKLSSSFYWSYHIAKSNESQLKIHKLWFHQNMSYWPVLSQPAGVYNDEHWAVSSKLFQELYHKPFVDWSEIYLKIHLFLRDTKFGYSYSIWGSYSHHSVRRDRRHPA